MDSVSLVVLTENNGNDIFYFVQHVHKTFIAANIAYEIIFVDKNSVDLTQHIIKQLSQAYPVQLIITSNTTDKKSQLIAGATYALHPILATIDITEYSPSAIVQMLTKISLGYDIVVARRIWERPHQKRKFWINFFISFLGKKLHALDMDVTSGLKVFRKEIFEKLIFSSSSSFYFDLEFLVKARNAGYKITEIPIPFEKYFVEKHTENTTQNTIAITGQAINLKFSNPDVIPFGKDHAHKKGQGFHFKGKEFIHYSQLAIFDSAFFRLASNQKKLFLLLGLLFFIGILLSWHMTIVTIIALLTFLYFSDLLFHLYLIVQSFTKSPEIVVTDEELFQEKDWPVYTIFCPLYKESAILAQFVHGVESLDYPKEKLQVILLLEKDDHKTRAKVKQLRLPSFFEIRIPMQTNPKTKPKALNFGLQFARGEYCVVYDAEDIPDPLQLKKAIIAFKKADPSVKCMQAKLNFYNPFQNILTRVFTAEYSLWFDLILTGLQSSESVIPLGGTSNHFRTRELKHLQGWDSFNVTEDCDLGLRIARFGFRTAIVNSTTLEEANSNAVNWFYQRGRWIKGYMQTYLVHSRNPKIFLEKASIRQFITFQLVIGGKVMSLFINPLMWTITIVYFAFRSTAGTFIESFFPGPVMYMGVLCLVFGNFLYLYYYMIGCAKREQYSLIKYAFLVPLYWLGMSFSGLYALHKIITQPHYWPKTRHGLHLSTSPSLPSPVSV